jgi:hypothetical protein
MVFGVAKEQLTPTTSENRALFPLRRGAQEIIISIYLLFLMMFKLHYKSSFFKNRVNSCQMPFLYYMR